MDRSYDFKNIFTKIFGEKIGILYCIKSVTKLLQKTCPTKNKGKTLQVCKKCKLQIFVFTNTYKFEGLAPSHRQCEEWANFYWAIVYIGQLFENFRESPLHMYIFWATLFGLAKKDDFRAITAKNAD
jgi:hypothetical protein